jgi:hypothetical protein
MPRIILTDKTLLIAFKDISMNKSGIAGVNALTQEADDEVCGPAQA